MVVIAKEERHRRLILLDKFWQSALPIPCIIIWVKTRYIRSTPVKKTVKVIDKHSHFEGLDAYRRNNSLPLEIEHHPKSTGSGNEWFPLWTILSSLFVLSSAPPSKRAFLSGLSICVSILRVIGVRTLSGVSCLTICASAFSRAASAKESMFPIGAVVWSAAKTSTSRSDGQSSCNPRSLSVVQAFRCGWFCVRDSARVEASDWQWSGSCWVWELDFWKYFVSNSCPWGFWTNGWESIHMSTKPDRCRNWHTLYTAGLAGGIPLQAEQLFYTSLYWGNLSLYHA